MTAFVFETPVIPLNPLSTHLPHSMCVRTLKKEWNVATAGEGVLAKPADKLCSDCLFAPVAEHKLHHETDATQQCHSCIHPV